jgi:thioredoxin 1
MALEINDANFEELVIKSDKPIMVDFWAAWCAPCMMIAPVIEEIANEYEGKATVGKVDVDASMNVAAKYGIRSIPTVFFFKDGRVVDKQIGAASKQVYTNKLDAIL